MIVFAYSRHPLAREVMRRVQGLDLVGLFPQNRYTSWLEYEPYALVYASSPCEGDFSEVQFPGLNVWRKLLMLTQGAVPQFYQGPFH